MTSSLCDTIPTHQRLPAPGGRQIPVDLALYQPDIAQNAGTLLRLSACLGFALHVIHPTGFVLSDRALKRASLDYADAASLVHHDSFAHFEAWREQHGRRLVLLTTRAEQSAYDAAFASGDILMVGRETAGVPPEVAATADVRLRIPMRDGQRSINVALAAAMVLGEAFRQTGRFGDLA